MTRTTSLTETLRADVKALWHFVGRRNVYARQRPDGGYETVREPLTPDVLERHLRGEVTIGTYTVTEALMCHHVILDFDFKGVPMPSPAEIRQRTENALATLDFPSKAFLLEFSGSKGYHVWLFFEPALPQKVAYRLGLLLKRLTKAAESYPKSEDVTLTEKQLGLQVKLPLGVHRHSKNRSFLYGEDNESHPAPSALIAERIILSPGLAEAALRKDVAGPPDLSVLPDLLRLPKRHWLAKMIREGIEETSPKFTGRNAALTKTLGYLLAKGLPPEVATATVEMMNEYRCYRIVDGKKERYPLKERELNSILASLIGRWERQRTEALPLVQETWLEFRTSPICRVCTHGERSTYDFVILLEWKRGVPPGTGMFVNREEAEDGGAVGRRNITRTFQNLRDKKGLIEFKEGRQGQAHWVRRVLPLPSP